MAKQAGSAGMDGLDLRAVVPVPAAAAIGLVDPEPRAGGLLRAGQRFQQARRAGLAPDERLERQDGMPFLVPLQAVPDPAQEGRREQEQRSGPRDEIEA